MAIAFVFSKCCPYLSQPEREGIELTNLISQTEIQYKMTQKLAKSVLK